MKDTPATSSCTSRRPPSVAVVVRGDTIEIPLARRGVAIIDRNDARLAAHRWRLIWNGYDWYAGRHVPRDANGVQRTVLLHREVLGVTDPAVHVDHINGDGLDCRRVNLRTATPSENGANRGPQANNASGFKGVSWHAQSGKWQARIGVRGRRRSLGLHATPEEAARAYDAAAREDFGAFAYLNFPFPGSREAACPRVRG